MVTPKVFFWKILSAMIAVLWMIFSGTPLSADELSTTSRHPRDEIVGIGAPVCTNCHEGDTVALKPVKAFDHGPKWYNIHKYPGSYAADLCNSCHRMSYCADCHGHKEELKPSLKYAGQPSRAMPHRGSYMLQHRIDGRVDPARCFKCHGNRNNHKCKRCHQNVQ